MDGPAFAKFGKEWAKYMKRGISFFLACIMMAGMVLTAFSGCSSQDKYMNSGEWLCLINEKFGFSYMDEKAYETSVDSDSEYYNAVQIAYGYGVLPDELTDIKVGSSLTNELCALTLAGAIYEPDSREVTISDISKTEYPDAVITVVNQEIMPLGSGDKFSPNKKVLYEDAVEYLDKAFYSWKNHHYDSYMNYTLNENVVDLAGLSTYYSYEETHEAPEDSDDASAAFETSTEYALDQSYVEDQRKWLSDNHFEYNADTGIVKLDNVSEKGIVKGSVLTIPDSLEYPTGLFLKVDEVTEAEDGSFVLSVKTADVNEIYNEDFEMQTSMPINFADAVMYGPDGEIISEGKYADSDMNVSPIAYIPLEQTTLSLGVSKVIKLDDKWKATISGKDGKIGVTLAYGSNVEISKEFSNVTADIKIEKGLLGPKIKGNHKFGLNFDSTDKLAVKLNNVTSGKEGTQIWDAQNALKYIALMAEMKQPVSNGLKENITRQKLVDIPIPICGGVAITIGVYIKASVNGTIDVSIGYSDGGMALEVRKLKPVFTCTNGRIVSKSVSGSITVEAGPALQLNFCLGPFSVADAEAWFGLGAKCESKLTSVYEDHTMVESQKPILLSNDVAPAAYNIMKTLAIDSVVHDAAAVVGDVANNNEDVNEMLFCLDVRTYWFISANALTQNCLIGKVVGPFTFKLGGDGDTTICSMHFEASTSQTFHETECTLAERINVGVQHGDALQLSEQTELILKEGDEKIINITMLPETKRKYYILSDLKLKSDDDEVALASWVNIPDQGGLNNKAVSAIKNFLASFKPQTAEEAPGIKITAVKEGRTTVTLSTRDGAYKIPLNVTVIPKNTDTQEYMAVSIDTFFIGATVGETVKLNAVSIPEGKTADDVFWETDDTSIVNVNSLTGEIIGLAEGSCNVMAYIPGYEKNAVKCRVTVSPDYSVTGTSYGEAAPNGQLVII